jgi:hypothetical protein
MNPGAVPRAVRQGSHKLGITVVTELIAIPHVRCSLPPVQIVVKRLKFLSNPAPVNQFIAVTALEKLESRRIS